LTTAIRAAGGRLDFLPAYSPELNPIEGDGVKGIAPPRCQCRILDKRWSIGADALEAISPSEGFRSHSLVPSAPVRRHQAWRRIAEDIEAYDGYLSEVTLDPNQDPAPLVEVLIDWFRDRVRSPIRATDFQVPWDRSIGWQLVDR
jgi:hypothetical protein